MQIAKIVQEVLPLAAPEKTKRPNVDSYIKPEILFEFAGQGILVSKESGEIVRVNSAAERMFGYAANEMLGKQLEMLIHENSDPGYASLRQKFLFPNKIRALGTGLELVAKRKDGALFPIEAGLNPIETPEGNFIVSIVIDITQRRQQEDLLKKAHQNLQYYARELQASNFELENFAYVSSHDLLEPLRKIQAFGERLKIAESANFTAQGRDYLDRVLHASERMESLINDLLTFSRLSTRTQPFAPVDLNAIVKGVLADLEVSVEKNNAILEVDELPVIDAEPTQMRQLFQNLIANAIKFRKESEPPYIKISVAKLLDESGKEFYDISFADNGIGFDEKYKEKIFNIFQTLAGRKYEGSGIGLAICRKIAIRHGGNIVAKSTPNIGSVFIASLAAKHEELPQK